MIYLTLADDYSGVYASQVLDVCEYFRQWLGIPIRLIALVPPSNLKKNYAKIKKSIPDATVFPMWPSRFDWRRNKTLFHLLSNKTKGEIVVSRGTLAANLAIHFRNKGNIKRVVYDARGATTAEWIEYLHDENEKLNNIIEKLEANAILNSDFRMSISEVLIDYWRSRFGYESSEHIIIPTTLSKSFLEPLITGDHRKRLRSELGFEEDDIILTYSGSSAGWQSFSTMKEVIGRLLRKNEKAKLLLLTNNPGILESVKDDFPGRVVITSYPPVRMFGALNVADYGLLIRDESITNKVSAPTKFAEYLAAGCNLLLKGNIGDYNKFVSEKGCGFVFDQLLDQPLHSLTNAERDRNNELAHKYFCKYSDVIEEKYRHLITQIIN